MGGPRPGGAWLRAGVLVALLGGAAAQMAAPTPELVWEALVDGQKDEGTVIVEGEYKRYQSTLLEDHPFVVTFTTTPIMGDVDLYLSDEHAAPSRQLDEYVWKSTTRGSRKQEVVTLYFEGSAIPRTLYLAVHCYFGQMTYADSTYLKRCTFDASMRVGDFEVTLLSDSRSNERQSPLAVGDYRFYQFNLADGLQKVNFRLGTNSVQQAGQTSTDVTFVVALDPDFLFLQQRLGANVGTGREGRLKITTVQRGQSVDLTLYLEGPMPIYISVSNGMLKPAAWEDQALTVRALSYTEPVEMFCLSPNRLETLKQAISYDEVHFWALPIVADNQILRMELSMTKGESELIVNQADWPLPVDRADYPDRTDCRLSTAAEGGSCARTLRTESVALPANLAVAAQANSLCHRIVADVANKSSIKYVLFSVTGKVPAVASEYVLRALEVNQECGWRPNCQSCSNGGKGCTWCNRHGGYCDELAAAADQYELCEQAAWCDDSSNCNQATECGECSSLPNCGWCANSGTKGICTQGTSGGPSNGVCDAWLYGADADCSVQCSIHDDTSTHAQACGVCAQETVCGFCHSPVRGQCLVGDSVGAASHTCPGNGTKWVHLKDECFTVTGELPTDVEPMLIGSEANVTLSLSETGQCFLSACSFAVLAVSLAEGQAVNLRASAAVSPATGDRDRRGLTATATATADTSATAVVALYMRHGTPPTREAWDAVAQPAHALLAGTLQEDEAGLTLVSGACQELTDNHMYFTLYMDPTSPVPDVQVRFRMDTEPTGITLDSRQSVYGSMHHQSICCGGMRQHAIKIVGTENGWVHVKLSYKTTSFTDSLLRNESLATLQLYARAGACPTRSVHDHHLNDTTGGQTLHLPILKDLVQWHLGVTADTFDMTVYELVIELEPEEPVGSGSIMDIVFGGSGGQDLLAALLGAGGALIVTTFICGIIGVRERRRANRYKALPAGNLLENSRALALGLEEHEDMAQLTWDNPMLELTQMNPLMGPGGGVLTTISGQSPEEQELVELIEGMSEKIKHLELQNEHLRQVNSTGGRVGDFGSELGVAPSDHGSMQFAPQVARSDAGGSDATAPLWPFGGTNLNPPPQAPQSPAGEPLRRPPPVFAPPRPPAGPAGQRGNEDLDVSADAPAVMVHGHAGSALGMDTGFEVGEFGTDVGTSPKLARTRMQQRALSRQASQPRPTAALAAMLSPPSTPLKSPPPAAPAPPPLFDAPIDRTERVDAEPTEPATSWSYRGGLEDAAIDIPAFPSFTPPEDTDMESELGLGMGTVMGVGEGSPPVGAPVPARPPPVFAPPVQDPCEEPPAAAAPPAAPPTVITPTVAASTVAASTVASSAAAPLPLDAMVPPTQFPPLPQPRAPVPETAKPRFRIELLCPDGRSLLLSTGVQVVGRNMGGVTSKKVSREQATLTVDTHTGSVVLTAKGKNGMLWRASEDDIWLCLLKNQNSPRLATQSEFSLLGREDAGAELENVTFMVLIKRLE